jgi:threonylcarbamoyladenosine tRNA methylthiotransferase MtaB
MSTARTIAFHTLGCKLNYSETSSISKLFYEAGYQEKDFKEEADVYVINTCSVTDEADKKCRKAVRQAIRKNGQAKVVVIGCYAQLKPTEIASIPGVSMVLGASEKFNILHHLQKTDIHSPHSEVIAREIAEAKVFYPSHSIEDRTRTFLKIQDGCDYKCSFCTIPLARGKSRSGELEDIVNQAKEIGQKGIKEIVLTGVNIGDFGNGTEVIEGIKPKKEHLFIDLIRALDEIESVARFRISSIEPNLCTPEIIEFVSKSKRFMPHFHMPLQSGDNFILSQMKRRYKRELYAERVSLIKQLMPHACIGVDVIVGFPGEENTHFENTCQFIMEQEISYLHVFSYSERPNTTAIEINPKVSSEIIHQRSNILRSLSDKKNRIHYSSHEGASRYILWEQSGDDNYITGFTDNYIKIRHKYKPKMENSIEKITIGKVRADGICELQI